MSAAAAQPNDAPPVTDRCALAGIESAPTAAAPSITLGAATGGTGGTVTATVANGPGAPGDWVGLYDAGGNAVSWQYLNGTQVKPATGVTTAAVNLKRPAKGGSEEARGRSIINKKKANSRAISMSAT